LAGGIGFISLAEHKQDLGEPIGAFGGIEARDRHRLRGILAGFLQPARRGPQARPL